jgi:ABC-2 type transport system permease protein
VLLIVGFSLGVDWPGLGGLALTIFFVMCMGALAACWGVLLALHYKSQSAAPAMQSGMFVLILTTTAYAPFENLQGWLSDVAHVNPLTQVVEAMRQGFFTDGAVTWANTWPGLVAMAGLIAVLGSLALREMQGTSY